MVHVVGGVGDGGSLLHPPGFTDAGDTGVPESLWAGGELQPQEGMGRGKEHQLVLLGGEQRAVGLASSGLGRGVAEPEAGGAGEAQQEGTKITYL